MGKKHTPEKTRRRVSAPRITIASVHALANKKDSANTQNVLRAKLPAPPDYLDKAAIVEWNYTGSLLLQTGMVTEIDRATFAIYCEGYSMYQRAVKEIKKAGGNPLLKNKDGAYYRSQWLDIRNRERAEMFKYLALFGLSPHDRLKINPNQSPARTDVPRNEFDDM